MNVLLVYLAGSSASVLENVLVEKEQVASAVYYSTEMRPDIVITFALSNVATKRLAEVEARFFELLKKTADRELDLTYLKDCIRRERRQILSAVETASTPFSEHIIYDFLFAKRDGSMLRAELESLREYDELETWTDSTWRQLIKKWMSDAPHVTILGTPSAKLSKKLEADEKARIAAQKKRLGSEGLKALEMRLAQAKAENDKEIPKEILERFQIPSTKSIQFIKTTTARSGLAKTDEMLDNHIQQLVDQDESSLPLFIHFEHTQSNFVQVHLIVSTESLPIALRPLLSVYLENFFASPISRNGQRIEFEQVIMELEKDTVTYGIGLGSGIGNPEVLSLSMQVELEKYATAIQWLEDVIWNAIFDVEVCYNSTC